MTHLKQFPLLAATLVTAAFLTPSLEARTCSGNADVLGSYGYFGSRGGVFFAGATPPGSTAAGSPILIPTGGTTPPTTVTGSNTPFGRFVTGLANNGVLSANGRIYFDGTGSVYAASTSGSLLLNTLAGSYTVSSDCSIRITLNDPFTPPAADGTATGPKVTLEGEVVDNRIEAAVTGSNAAGATVTFVRVSQNSCSNASLQGNFSIVGSGFGQANSSSSATPGAFMPGANGALGAPFSLLGRFTADGNGILVPDASGISSPFKRTLIGTYNVSVDCTGTATLVDSAGVTRNIGFVLANDNRCVSGPTSANQSLQFVFTESGFVGNGSATRQ